MAQWQRSGDSLPSDEKKLARIARAGRNWPKVWAALGRFFQVDEDGVFNIRLRYEAQICAAKREVNKHNGARGGTAKALKRNNSALESATNSLGRNAWRNSSIPEPEPYKKKEEPYGSMSSGADDAAALPADQHDPPGADPPPEKPEKPKGPDHVEEAFAAYNAAAALFPARAGMNRSAWQRQTGRKPVPRTRGDEPATVGRLLSPYVPGLKLPIMWRVGCRSAAL